MYGVHKPGLNTDLITLSVCSPCVGSMRHRALQIVDWGLIIDQPDIIVNTLSEMSETENICKYEDFVRYR